MLYSSLALRRKEGGIGREKKYELSMLSNQVKNHPKHPYSRTKSLSQKSKNTIKHLESLLAFSCMSFSLFLSS